MRSIIPIKVDKRNQLRKNQYFFQFQAFRPNIWHVSTTISGAQRPLNKKNESKPKRHIAESIYFFILESVLRIITFKKAYRKSYRRYLISICVISSKIYLTNHFFIVYDVCIIIFRYMYI